MIGVDALSCVLNRLIIKHHIQMKYIAINIGKSVLMQKIADFCVFMSCFCVCRFHQLHNQRHDESSYVATSENLYFIVLKSL